MGRHVIGIGNVVDGHRLRAVLLANPVGVGQVDADGRRGVAVAAEHRHGDDLGRDALHLLLAVLGSNGRVVLEPLCVLRDDRRAVAGRRVDEVDNRLPRSLAAQRVTVILDEAVDEVDVRHRVAHPADVEAVELTQVARAVVGYQRGDVRLLGFVGHRLGLFEPVDNPLDGRRVHAAHLPDPLAHLAVLLDQLRVESVGNGLRVVGVGHGGVELLDLGLGYPLVVVVRRGGHQVRARRLVQTRGVERRVENRLADLAAQGVQLAEALLGDGLDDVEQVALRKFGDELVVRVVVVDAVGEPDLLEVLLQSLPFGRRTVALEVLIDGLQRAAHGQVVLEVLVVEDVTAALGRLREVVNQLLLLERQLLEAGNLVTNHLDVVETVDHPGGLALRMFSARSQHSAKQCHGNGNR